MQNAVPVGKGSMLAVLGLEISEIKFHIKNIEINNGICEIANDNANGQVIVSGEKESVKIFQNYLKDKKIKSIPLKVSAPFHCSLMKPAAETMREKISKINFEKPIIKIVTNVTAKAEDDPKNIKNLLVDQICSPVRWRESLINISEEDIQSYIEIGPGKALSGMVKRTIKNVNCFSINTITDIKNFINEFKR